VEDLTKGGAASTEAADEDLAEGSEGLVEAAKAAGL
jgi:hypothetical protein